ncbi:MAG: hypothetical protein QNJ40_23785 [Xanthomonadales bacterium]|nr:hypothetical protein [Xanthomonadales bacterium]
MRSLFAAILLSFVSLAGATIEGTFWDPRFNGEGWTIESQNDLAFLTWYTYEADGSPTFRTAVCTVTYEAVSLDEVVVTLTGTLSITRNRTETTELGPFTAEFRPQQGRLVGTVSANGEERVLEPFNFNFVNDADFLHGIWSVAEVSTTETDSDTIIFNVAQAILEDGLTPAKEFTTLDSGGTPGFAYFDEDEEAFVAVQEIEDNNIAVAKFFSTDDKALGFVFETDPNGNVISDPSVILAASSLNTEGERSSQAGLLGVIANRKSKPLTIPMRKVRPHTFEQMRERLRLLRDTQADSD